MLEGRDLTFVCFYHYPGRSVGNPKVQHLLSHYVGVKVSHDLFDRSSKVPPTSVSISHSGAEHYQPMHVENVNVIRSQLFQTIPYGNMHTLR